MATYNRDFSTGAHQFNLATSPAACGGLILTKRYLPTDSEVQIHLSTADARCLLIHLQLALAGAGEHQGSQPAARTLDRVGANR